MKKVLIVLSLLALPVWLFAQNRSIAKFYEKYESREGITTLNISGSLLQFLFKGERDADARKEINCITGLRMIAAGKDRNPISPADIRKLRSEIKTDRYEDLMEIRDGETFVNFVVQESRGKITELVMLIDDPKEFVIISFSGEIDPKKLEKTFRDVDIQGGKYLDRIEDH